MALLTSPTLQNLISEVRIILNQKDPNNSFWSDIELTNYLNEGCRTYFIECVQANEGYFTTTANLDITSGSDSVALPNDFFEMRKVYKKVTNGFIALPYRNNLTAGFTTQGGSDSESFLPYYYFLGNNLILRPTPNFNETAGIRIEYLQFPDNMIYGGDTMTNQISPVFKHLIVMYAVYSAKLKESMVNGVQVHQVPESKLVAIYDSFKKVIERRSRNPVFVEPYNPETEIY